MKVTVKLFATLREYGDNQKVMDFPEGTSVLDVVKQLELPKDDVAIIMINGRHAKLETELKEEDVLALFPPVGGG
jgi:molybdopterin converting factor small subunit